MRSTDHSINKYGNDILRYIGGKNHAICHLHKHPLIPVPDRIANCSKCSSRKEHYRCPKLGCYVCLCNRCFNELSDTSVNYINTSETSREEQNDVEVTNDDDGDNSYASDEDPHPQGLANEFNNEGPDGLCNVPNDDLDTDSETEPVEKDYLMTDRDDGVVERNDLEDFVTHGRTDFGYDSDDS